MSSPSLLPPAQRGASPHHAVDEAWLGLRTEEALDPGRPIVDPHHRLGHRPPPPDLLLDARFRAGFATLAPLGRSFEAWCYHPQLPQLIDLVDAFPDTTVVLNHVGGRAGLGPYAQRRDEVRREWTASIRALAERPNVVIKLGGLGMRLAGFDFFEGELPPTSQELADAWQPDVQTCIDAFGPSRAMFESNFPVDKACCSYRVIWNAFKGIAAGHTEAEQADLFAGTAIRVYRLPEALGR